MRMNWKSSSGYKPNTCDWLLWMENTTQNTKTTGISLPSFQNWQQIAQFQSLFFWPILTGIHRGRTYLIDEELQLDDGGSALVLAVALNAGPSEPEGVASQGRNKLRAASLQRWPRSQTNRFARQ